MRDSRWKLRTERDEHLFVFAMMPAVLALLLPYIGIESLKEYTNMGSAMLGVIWCWMLIVGCSRRKLIKLPNILLHIWVAVNAIMSLAVIITTIGIIFWGW